MTDAQHALRKTAYDMTATIFDSPTRTKMADAFLAAVDARIAEMIAPSTPAAPCNREGCPITEPHSHA